MTITATRQDAKAVRDILLQAVDSTVQTVLQTFGRRPQSKTLPALLDKIAGELHDAPALSDDAVSRSGISADHP